MCGKRGQGQGAGVDLSPKPKLDEALPIIQGYVNETLCSALLDSSCSRTIVFADLCRTWKEKGVSVTTISGETRTCCGVGAVNIRTRTGNSANVEALVVLEKLLSFDLLLGYDAIRALGGVHIMQTEAVQFQEKTPVCAALRIDQPDFSVKFDQHQKAWTTSWRWSGNQELAKLRNGVAEYHVPDQIRPAYEEELHKRIKDGWLIPYPYEKLGPPKGLIPLMVVAQHNKAKVRLMMDYVN